MASFAGPLVWLIVVSTVLAMTGYLFALAIWFVSLGTSFWAIQRLRTWTEHSVNEPGERSMLGTPAATHFVRLTWWQRALIAPHASWAHYEHHKHPGIPFWRLREISEPSARTKSLGELFASFETAS